MEISKKLLDRAEKEMLVIYYSKSGFTKKYAQWLADAFSCEMKEYNEVRPADLLPYQLIVYCASNDRYHIRRIETITANDQILADKDVIVLVTGMTPENAISMDNFKNLNFTKDQQERIPLFYARGGLDYNNLLIKDQYTLSLMRQVFKKEHRKDSTAQALMSAMEHAQDYTDREKLKPVFRLLIEKLQLPPRKKTEAQVVQPTTEQRLDYLRLCNTVAQSAKDHKNSPFGAILVDAVGTVVLKQENIADTENICTGHAELKLVEQACRLFDVDFLKQCTIYSNVEPCAMCSGAIYLSGIRTVVFGIAAQRRRELLLEPEETAQHLPACAELLSDNDKQIRILGPFPEMEDEIMALFLNE